MEGNYLDRVLETIRHESEGEEITPELIVASACWKAREVLGAYMLSPVSVETEPSDLPSVKLPHSKLAIPPMVGPEIKDPILHQTYKLDVNDKLNISLSNRPFWLDDEGLLHPITRPGYTALHVEKNTLPISLNPPLRSTCDQVIFRIPNPGLGEDAAIFHGFDTTDQLRVDQDQAKVLKLTRLLAVIALGMRELLFTNQRILDNTYLSTTPDESVDQKLRQFLEGTA